MSERLPGRMTMRARTATSRTTRPTGAKTPESVLALSWLARTALAQKKYDQADRYAEDTYQRVLLGASIEVEAQVLAAKGRGPKPFQCWRRSSRNIRRRRFMLGFKTNITINKPIEVEGTVLPAGSYVLKLVDLQSERHLVRILNAEENRVIATVFTTPIYKFTPADKSEFNFYEPENGRPPALHAWFYPGDSAGF